jgi:hypothetical protein
MFHRIRKGRDAILAWNVRAEPKLHRDRFSHTELGAGVLHCERDGYIIIRGGDGARENNCERPCQSAPQQQSSLPLLRILSLLRLRYSNSADNPSHSATRASRSLRRSATSADRRIVSSMLLKSASAASCCAISDSSVATCCSTSRMRS